MTGIALNDPIDRQLEIGSYFASDDSFLRPSAQNLPQAIRMADGFVETGRQALNAIVAALVTRGVRDVFLPGYLCESVLSPFLTGRLNVHFLSMTPAHQIDLKKLDELEAATVGPHTAVFMVRYFGYARDAEYLERISRLQSQGTIVIEDLTHALFDRAAIGADYAFASLRKLLPVATGATLSGTRAPGTVTPRRAKFHQQVWGLMTAKRDYLAGKSVTREFYAGMVSATAELEAEEGPHLMDLRSQELLPYFAYDLMREARTANFGILVKHLEPMPELKIVNGQVSPAATHLVVSIARSEQLRRHLVSRKIYCPVHWPRPVELPTSISWPTNEFSIPLDHRYASGDMLRIVRALDRYVRQ